MAAPLLLPSLIMAWFFFPFALGRPLSTPLYKQQGLLFYSAHQKLAFSCAFANPFDFITCDLETKASHSKHFFEICYFSSLVKFLALGIWHGVKHARVPSGPVLRSGVLFSSRWKTVHPSAWLFDPAPSALTVCCVPANITGWWSGCTVVSRR